MRCYIALYGGGATAAESNVPPGWGLISRTASASNGVILYIFGRSALAADPAAGWTWVFDSARSASGCIVTYRDTTASTYARMCSGETIASASAASHFSPSTQTSNVASQWAVMVYAAAQQDTWTQDAAATERVDDTTTAGANDVCISVADVALGGTGAIPGYEALLDSAVAAEAVTAVEVLTTMGIYQAAGGNTPIVMHDNTKSASAAAFNAAELFYGFPHTFRKVATQGSRIAYENFTPTGTPANITIGQTSSPQTTTWRDTNVNINMNTGNLATAATSLSSWHIEWGTKIGSGDEAGGTDGVVLNTAQSVLTMRGHLKLYGCVIQCQNAASIANGAASLDGDIQGCTLMGPAFTLGSSTFPLANLYDTTIQSTSTTSTDILKLFFATKSKKVRMACQTFRSFLGANTTAAFKPREIIFKGTPATADVRWGGAGVTGWYLVQPEWSGNAAKFAIVASGNPSLANATLEYRTFNVKVVSSTGTAFASIPVKLTDLQGNLVVDTTTDSNGRISFGSGQLANAVIVMDHYAVTTVYTQRHRSPFLLEVNTGNSRDTTHQSLRTKFYWPGYEGITTSAGSFEDINMIVPLETATGLATSWIEASM